MPGIASIESEGLLTTTTIKVGGLQIIAEEGDQEPLIIPNNTTVQLHISPNPTRLLPYKVTQFPNGQIPQQELTEMVAGADSVTFPIGVNVAINFDQSGVVVKTDNPAATAIMQAFHMGHNNATVVCRDLQTSDPRVTVNGEPLQYESQPIIAPVTFSSAPFLDSVVS
jgi:hypothetical protein